MAGTIPTEQPQDSVTLKSAHHAEKWANSAYFTADGVLFDMVSDSFMNTTDELLMTRTEPSPTLSLLLRLHGPPRLRNSAWTPRKSLLPPTVDEHPTIYKS
jgi:hypothetical protein